MSRLGVGVFIPGRTARATSGARPTGLCSGLGDPVVVSVRDTPRDEPVPPLTARFVETLPQRVLPSLAPPTAGSGWQLVRRLLASLAILPAELLRALLHRRDLLREDLLLEVDPEDELRRRDDRPEQWRAPRAATAPAALAPPAARCFSQVRR
mmetsp:Transcript_98675/g.226727  ORF Transcript_98675/g.226727 Transcript_98675/m.226727 type:complete len:153 (+) Transcript_98675:1766-2224(+)